MHYVVFAVLTLWLTSVRNIELPGTCQPGQFYDSAEFICRNCPANASMVPSEDGFACVCAERSVPSGVASCRTCSATEVVSADGRSCVPRKCQTVGSRLVCRKCPGDYIAVTQNLDGSAMKEMTCVKCARGYRAVSEACVPCEACACAKHEVALRGRCVPKRFVDDRPKYDETKLHPFVLLDVVKYEYLCSKNDVRSCSRLADLCVRNFYLSDLAGPCRFWIQPKIVPPKHLPTLTIETTSVDKSPGEFVASRGMQTLKVSVIAFNEDGRVQALLDNRQESCFLPVKVGIGRDYSIDCKFNVTSLEKYTNETYSPFFDINGELKPLPVTLRKPGELYVQREKWPNSKFRRYFLIDNYLSTVANTTNVVYLRTLIISVSVERDKSIPGSLRVKTTVEAQYATKSPLSQTVTITLRVDHDLPSAGVMRGLEIWGGVLGTTLAMYAIVQWRGTVRRGGLHFSITPMLAGCVADVLYFSALFSTLHALAAEAGTLGMTLPLSKNEEYMIRAFLYSAIALKALKVVWINWKQCQCDMFFLDWSEYNPPVKANPSMADKSSNWRAQTLAREWSSLQTKRRASPGYTVVLALAILQLLTPWQNSLPLSRGYHCAVASLAWWSAYVTVMTSRWLVCRLLWSPVDALSKVCAGVGISLIVFQEEYYAHCVHGRNHDSDARFLAGTLESCRLVCAPQLRTVYKQLSSPTIGTLGEAESKQTLLSRFLAAFFERALDGLGWVASERTVLERLFDVELLDREAGNTSTLLYDPGVTSASCFAVTWWGEEWALGTFDAMLFGSVVIATGHCQLSALVTIVVWQVLKGARSWFGDKNQTEKTNVEIIH